MWGSSVVKEANAHLNSAAAGDVRRNFLHEDSVPAPRNRARFDKAIRPKVWLQRPAVPALAFLLMVLLGSCRDDTDRVPTVGPDGKSVVAVRKSGDKRYVEKDGKQVGGKYDVVHTTLTDPAGTPVFAAKSGDSWGVMRGDKPVGAGYDFVGGLTVAPTGSIAFAAKKGDKWSVIKDGAEVGGSYEHVQGLTFSPDGTSLAFTAMDGGKAFLVRDGVRQPGDYEAVSSPSFTGDGGSVVFVAADGESHVLVKDGKVISGPHDYIASWAVAPDGGSVAVLVMSKSNGEYFLVKNGASTGAKFPYAVGVTSPVFAPDGQTVAFAVAQPENLWTVVRDGVPQSEDIEADALTQMVFSPDGRSIAAIIRRGAEWFVLKDGRIVSEAFDGISNLRSSDDGRKLTSSGVRRNKAVQVELPW